MDSVDLEVLRAARRWLAERVPVALSTVVKTWGSSPRPVGAVLAVQLNPQHPSWYNWGYHNYFYHKRQYDQALQAAQKIGLENVFWTPVGLAEVNGQLGRNHEASAAAARIAALYPGFNLRIARNEMEKFNFPEEHIRHRLDGLRKAGVPE